MKVLHVVPTLKKDGAEVQLSEIFKNFNNIEVELFTFDKYEYGDSIVKNLGNIVLHHNSSIIPIFFYKLIKENNYNIIHSHYPNRI